MSPELGLTRFCTASSRSQSDCSFFQDIGDATAGGPSPSSWAAAWPWLHVFTSSNACSRTAILRFESTNIPVQPGERAPVVLLPPATVLSKARLIGYALKIQSAGLNNDLAHVQQVLRATKQIDTLRGPQSQASHI